MSRPFIEFLHCQNLDWLPSRCRPGAEEKTLSADDASFASTGLLRYPAGWTSAAREWCSVDEEFFLLNGSFRSNGRDYTRHHYGFWPEGYIREDFQVGENGATMIMCRSGDPSFSREMAGAPAVDQSALTEQINPFELPWDQTNMDPTIAHLNAYRKNLRLSPNGTCRTYLLGGLPQGYPKSGTEPLERHPHVEEMFMVSGDMPCSLGVMRPGAYFWRPPMIWHGADCTVTGFLFFARTPGSNKTISEWSAEPHPVRFDPEYRVQLPRELVFADKIFADPIAY